MSNYLFLDIDGVLNAVAALTHVSERRHPWQDYQLVDRNRPYGEIVSPYMVAALNHLVRRHNVTVLWCTTWEDKAAAFGEKIGLHGHWDWLDTTDRSGQWGKYASVAEYVKRNGPVHRYVWLDDDLHTEYEAQLWASQEGVLAIAPYVHHGITPAILHQLSRHYGHA